MFIWSVCHWYLKHMYMIVRILLNFITRWHLCYFFLNILYHNKKLWLVQNIFWLTEKLESVKLCSSRLISLTASTEKKLMINIFIKVFYCILNKNALFTVYCRVIKKYFPCLCIKIMNILIFQQVCFLHVWCIQDGKKIRQNEQPYSFILPKDLKW